MRIIGNNPAADNAEITAVASGTLPNGKPVIVNTDGTVSVVADTGASQALGSPAVFESVNSLYTVIAYDSNAQKVVIVYNDRGSNNVKAVVGTVSGTNISFGTPAVVESGEGYYMGIAYDSNAQKVVITYAVGSSYYGKAIVGTVSGTNISFGTPVVFESSSTSFFEIAYDPNAQKVVIATDVTGGSNPVGKVVVGTISGTGISFGSATTLAGLNARIDVTYDSNAQKVVISYTDQNSYGVAVVGTVSGTNISLGTPVVFASVTITGRGQKSAYDSNAQKIVIAYRPYGNSNTYLGTAIVGTVSGTSISFGTPVVFENAAVSPDISTTYDSNAQRIVISYSDAGNSSYGTLIVGTVNNTSISFGTAVVFESAATDSVSSVYDSNAQKVVTAYKDGGNSNYGTAVVFQTGYSSANLTSENYIGIANGAAADTGTARVQVGSGINGSQSSLTAGQQYFVQTDGTLGLTADDPSVIAGTAISATEIIVKG